MLRQPVCLWVCFSLTTIVMASCGSKKDSANEKENQRKAQALEDSIDHSQRLASIHSRYRAAWQWDSLNFEYTYSYQLAFEKHPTVIVERCALRDIWKTDSTTVFLFAYGDRYSGPDGFIQLSCQLDCTSAIDKVLPNLREKRDPYDMRALLQDDSNFIIVAEIQRVFKGTIAIDCESEYEGPEECSAHFTIDGAPRPFFFTGQLLEIID